MLVYVHTTKHAQDDRIRVRMILLEGNVMQEAYQEHAGEPPPLPQEMQAPQEVAGRASPLPASKLSEGNVKANLTQAGSTEAIPAVPSGRQAGDQRNVQDALMCPRAKASVYQQRRGNH